MLYTVLKIPVKGVNETFISGKSLKCNRVYKISGVFCHNDMNITF